MIIIRDGKEIILTVEEMEAAYKEIQLQYRMEDAECHVENMYYKELISEKTYHEITKDNYKEIAEEFLENHDCNVAENDAFQEIIERRER